MATGEKAIVLLLQMRSPAQAEKLYEHFVKRFRDAGVSVATGQFQARMKVSLVNDGPVTFLLES
jgi:D-aminoacyl-tRNA deacylase